MFVIDWELNGTVVFNIAQLFRYGILILLFCVQS